MKKILFCFLMSIFLQKIFCMDNNSIKNLVPLSDNVSSQCLKYVEEQKLGLFVNKDMLYCKISGKDNMAIPVDSSSAQAPSKSLPQNIHEKINMSLTEDIKDDTAFQMEGEHTPVETNHYSDAYSSIGNYELASDLDLISLYGYAPSKSHNFDPNLTSLPIEIQYNILDIAAKTSSNIINLCLVCREINNTLKRELFWERVYLNFRKENFNSFKELMKKEDWFINIIKKIKFISFKDTIEDDELEEEPEESDCFISSEDFKYILERADNLIGLHIENIPFLSTYLDCEFPFSKKIKDLSYIYDNFINIPYKEILRFSTFINLENLSIESSILQEATTNENFLSYLTNIRKLKLFNSPIDCGNGYYFSNIIYLLEPLINLECLEIDFMQEPCFKPLELLGGLNNLKNLNITFKDMLSVENTSLNTDDLYLILKSLKSLENIFINNEYYDFYIKEPYIEKHKIFNFSSKKTLLSQYPNLITIGGNMIGFGEFERKASNWDSTTMGRPMEKQPNPISIKRSYLTTFGEAESTGDPHKKKIKSEPSNKFMRCVDVIRNRQSSVEQREKAQHTIEELAISGDLYAFNFLWDLRQGVSIWDLRQGAYIKPTSTAKAEFVRDFLVNDLNPVSITNVSNKIIEYQKVFPLFFTILQELIYDDPEKKIIFRNLKFMQNTQVLSHLLTQEDGGYQMPFKKGF
jgi:hypothetical protein